MRNIRIVAVALVVAALMVALAAPSGAGGDDKGSLTVGSKDFPGAQVLGQVYGQALEADGYDIGYEENLGTSEIVYAALLNGDVDLYPDYQGTFLETILLGAATPESAEVFAAVEAGLPSDVVATQPAPAVDVNAFVVTKKTANRYDLETVSDLVEVAPELVFGAPPECETRPLCLGDKSQQLYGLDFESVEKLDAGGPITVKALEDGDIDVALLFSGSSVFPKGSVILEDDQGLQPADNPFVLVRADKDTPEINEIVDAVSAKITTKEYRKMSLAVTEDKEDPEDVAKDFLERKNLD